MVVIKAYMWPGGDPSQERFLSAATLTCLGRTFEDDEFTGLPQNTRLYRLVMLKAAKFGGPGEADLPATARAPKASDVWRKSHVGGHRPERRGLLDVLAGGLLGALGRRLDGYRKLSQVEADRLASTQVSLLGGRRG